MWVFLRSNQKVGVVLNSLSSKISQGTLGFSKLPIWHCKLLSISSVPIKYAKTARHTSISKILGRITKITMFRRSCMFQGDYMHKRKWQHHKSTKNSLWHLSWRFTGPSIFESPWTTHLQKGKCAEESIIQSCHRFLGEVASKITSTLGWCQWFLSFCKWKVRTALH